jgi:hypothetical protein
MSNQKNQAEKKGQELQINKGIEFMLRRRVDKVKPKHGLNLNKTFNLLRRTFNLHLEFSWEVDKPTRE